MKNHHNMRSFLLGVFTTLLVVAMIVPSFAAAATKSIEVRSGIRVFIDDKELIPKDAKGNPVEVFLYNGTTYLPARAISEAVGKPIQWDSSVQGIYIGKHSSDYPAAYLGQLDHFNTDCSWSFDSITKDNLGNEHTHSVDRTGSYSGFITYKLNAQYSRLTACYYQEYSSKDFRRGESYTLIISGDGRQLWQGTVAAGIEPIDIDINISGVLELTIEYPNGSPCYTGNTALGDVALWS